MNCPESFLKSRGNRLRSIFERAGKLGGESKHIPRQIHQEHSHTKTMVMTVPSQEIHPKTLKHSQTQVLKSENEALTIADLGGVVVDGPPDC